MIFIIGGAFTEGAERFLDTVPNPVVRKPFDPERIDSVLHEVAVAAERPGSRAIGQSADA